MRTIYSSGTIDYTHTASCEQDFFCSGTVGLTNDCTIHLLDRSDMSLLLCDGIDTRHERKEEIPVRGLAIYIDRI